MSPHECLDTCFASTFGCKEFEDLAKTIVEFLASDRRTSYQNILGMKLGGYEDGDGWKKRFTPNDLSPIYGQCSMFAAFCCGGWITHVHFPKGVFIVSDAFIERITKSECGGCKGSRTTFDKCTAGNPKRPKS